MIQPLLAVSIFLMLVRIVLSWYPNVKLDVLPWKAAGTPPCVVIVAEDSC